MVKYGAFYWFIEDLPAKVLLSYLCFSLFYTLKNTDGGNTMGLWKKISNLKFLLNNFEELFYWSYFTSAKSFLAYGMSACARWAKGRGALLRHTLYEGGSSQTWENSFITIIGFCRYSLQTNSMLVWWTKYLWTAEQQINCYSIWKWFIWFRTAPKGKGKHCTDGW